MNEFKKIIDLISPFLIDKKFVKKENSFYLFEQNNHALLNFQKSVSNTKSATSFTLNIGIRSSVISTFLYQELKAKKLIIDDCHWTARVGSLMGTNSDFWWQVEEGDSIEDVVIDVIEALNKYVIPAIEVHISDNGLKKEWLKAQYIGTSELNYYIYMTILLKLMGSPQLSEYVEKLINYTSKRRVNFNLLEHLERLDDIEQR